jgi:hypothetical protein
MTDPATRRDTWRFIAAMLVWEVLKRPWSRARWRAFALAAENSEAADPPDDWPDDAPVI